MHNVQVCMLVRRIAGSMPPTFVGRVNTCEKEYKNSLKRKAVE